MEKLFEPLRQNSKQNKKFACVFYVLCNDFYDSYSVIVRILSSYSRKENKSGGKKRAEICNLETLLIFICPKSKMKF